MKKTGLLIFPFIFLWMAFVACHPVSDRSPAEKIPAEYTLTKEQLLDKIKGGVGRSDNWLYLWRPDRVPLQRNHDPGLCTDRLAGRIYQILV